jgi:hypothetical protein
LKADPIVISLSSIRGGQCVLKNVEMNAVAVAILGAVGLALAVVDPHNSVIEIIVVGVIGALNLNPQKKDPAP